ncbi:hypothetical protein, partial [Bordetella pertussis]|uniref:hypothetical protein n=1 Tax=Bordetella pertussis TaxID=520 RepID=UPI0021CBC8DB
ASLPQRGLTVAATLPELDLDAWDAMKADFDEPSSGRRQPSRVPLLPQRGLTVAATLPELDLD